MSFPQLVSRYRLGGHVAAAALLSLGLGLLISGRLNQRAAAQVEPDPGGPGTFTWTSTAVSLTNTSADVYYPTSASAPYPALIVAHDVSSLIQARATRASQAGNAQHFASWGYIVVVPDLTKRTAAENGEVLKTVTRDLIAADADPNSPLYRKLDHQMIGMLGHGEGALAALYGGYQDERIRVFVGLHATVPSAVGPMAAVKVPFVQIKTGDVRPCAAGSAGYVYRQIGAPDPSHLHKASYELEPSAFLDFEDPSPARIAECEAPTVQARYLIRRLATAWLGQYLLVDPRYFTYLYGAEVLRFGSEGTGEIADMWAATYAWRVRGEAREPDTVRVTWGPALTPAVAGYKVYRQAGDTKQPWTEIGQVANIGLYEDVGLAPGIYRYRVRAFDPAGHLYLESYDSNDVRLTGVPPTLSPTATASVTPSPTPTRTPSPTPTRDATASPEWPIGLPVVAKNWARGSP
jgi:hypothetical protein